MAALAGIKSNILLSAGRVRQGAVGCRYFNMAKWLVHRKSGRPKQVAVHPRDRRWQVLLYSDYTFRYNKKIDYFLMYFFIFYVIYMCYYRMGKVLTKFCK